jgi:hypothetical protein
MQSLDDNKVATLHTLLESAYSLVEGFGCRREVFLDSVNELLSAVLAILQVLKALRDAFEGAGAFSKRIGLELSAGDHFCGVRKPFDHLSFGFVVCWPNFAAQHELSSKDSELRQPC